MWTFLFLSGLMQWNSLYFCLSDSHNTHTHTRTHAHSHSEHLKKMFYCIRHLSIPIPTRNLICFWYSLNIYGMNEWKAQWKMFEPPRPYCQQRQSAQISNLSKGWFWVSRREWSVERYMLGDQPIFLCKYQAAT